MTKQLSLEQGKQIIDAISRLTALGAGDRKVIDRNEEAERAGLDAYIRNQLFDHAGHLMGCWFAIKNEYEPLCNAFASFNNRAAAIQKQRRDLEAQLEKGETK